MAGNWQTITLPATVSSGGAFSGDLMLLLTDGSLFVHNAYGKEWLRFKPDSTGEYSGTTWSTVFTESEMSNTREYFASGILKDGRVFAIGGEDSDAGGDTPLGEIFDPQTNTWSKVNKPAAFDFICGDCNGAVLSDGRVLIPSYCRMARPSASVEQGKRRSSNRVIIRQVMAPGAKGPSSQQIPAWRRIGRPLRHWMHQLV
jgi:Galactose oxidase, central domain